ncbi:MAG: zinc-ribbon domain-containing protein [Candidatus Roseilinea sp.]|uniref:zinc-ribbon domain-containing protein n=1 Tax=Candidatus Roseilinea sp. TaxID=2838777 RepID=UPI00404A034B
MNATPKFCGQCGATLAQGARFCAQCGQAVASSVATGAPAAQQSAMPPAAPQPTPIQSEPVLGFVPGVQRRSGFLGLKAETFTIMVTPARLVFVPLGSEEIKQAVVEARDRAKQAGKGFFGRWAAQLAWMSIVCERLAATPVDTILASRAGSFFIPNAAVRSVRIQIDSDDESTQSTTRLTIDTHAGRHSYELIYGSSEEDAKALLRQVLGNIVK